jgi:hypothetical protein
MIERIKKLANEGYIISFYRDVQGYGVSIRGSNSTVSEKAYCDENGMLMFNDNDEDLMRAFDKVYDWALIGE